ncbi:nicotinamide riboside transporter PnuC [Legionella worsleiensis]|nr:nicotinamide riboside transporter PnuC [Legionella worsleiensis]
MFLDLLGALASLVSTLFFIRLSTKAWPLGILATVLNGWLYWHKGIYADMVLEVCYFLSMCYGWSLWHKSESTKNQPKQKPLGRLNRIQGTYLMIASAALFALIYYLLHTLTHSTVAVLDAATTSLSLLAQWFMCHKIMATWIVWFITDLLYAVMYLHKQLPFHSALMLIYTGLAVIGYITWSQKNRKFLATETTAQFTV